MLVVGDELGNVRLFLVEGLDLGPSASDARRLVAALALA